MKLPAKYMAASAMVVALGSVSATAGPCAEQITRVAKQLAASDAGMGPTGARPSTAGQKDGQEHPPSSVMSKETEQKAISPRDVQRQSGIKRGASDALALARKLDAQGRPECTDAVNLANELSEL